MTNINTNINTDIKVKDVLKNLKKVITDYQTKEQELIEQESALKEELFNLQGEHADSLLQQQSANISDLVYLKIQAKKLIEKAQIIQTVLEDLKHEKTALKLSYVPLLQSAQAKDSQVKAEYDGNEIVDRHVYAMFLELSEIGKQMQKQYHSIAPDIMDILDDPEVRKVHPNTKYQFTSDSYKPSFWESSKIIVHREDIRYALSGTLPQGLKKPKGVE